MQPSTTEFYDEPCDTQQARVALDRDMADETRRRLKQGEEARNHHREQSEYHQQQAEEAERTIKAAQAALNVLEPQGLADIRKVASTSGQITRY